MTSSSYQTGPWRRNKLLWTFTIGGLVFGILIAAYYHPKETIVEFPEETVDRRIVVGTNTITYNTTGPIITSFYNGCYTTDDFQGGGYYCLVLQYERGPGVVELKIPSYLLKDLIKNYQWIRTIEVDKVPVPFQRIGQDSKYTIFRVELPLETKYDKGLLLQDGYNSPLWADYIGNAALFSGIGFIVVAFSWMFFYFLIQYMKKRFGNETLA